MKRLSGEYLFQRRVHYNAVMRSCGILLVCIIDEVLRYQLFYQIRREISSETFITHK